MMKFSIGDKVTIKHQPEIGECIVINAYDQSDMIMVGGRAVEYYVRIENDKIKDAGYHYWNLELVEWSSQNIIV